MIRLFQLLLACAVLATAGYFILQNAPEKDPDKFKYFASKYQPESQEHKALYAQYSSYDDIPMPVGSWEAFSGSGNHYMLKVNKSGGFVLSVNHHANDSSEGAVTGVLFVTGSAFIAKHVVGTAKQLIPKSGHIVVKNFAAKEVQVFNPHTFEVITFNLIDG